jgi:hypothetical protein
MIKLDKVSYSSLHESFKNYDTLTGSITISGTIPPGGTTFSVNIPYTRTDTVAEISFIKSGGSTKRYVDNSYRLLDYAGGTNAFVFANYASNSVTITIAVDNPGAGYTPSSETYDFTVEVFEAPVSF